MIAYVILHYMALKDTIECANSILNNIDGDKQVIIVDNGSTNASYEKMKGIYNDDNRVHLIRNEKNIGYAQGNNIGYQYAKYRLNSDFIVLLNNDTVICQKDFSYKIQEKFEEYNYSVLGPDIETKDKKHQNPIDTVDWSFSRLFTFRIKRIVKYFISFIPFINENSPFFYEKDSYMNSKKDMDLFDVALHGACYIFSPLYVKKYDGLFDKTFLYLEEDILKLQADYYEFLMMYTPSLTVYHKEDIATSYIHRTNKKKYRIKAKHLIKSLRLYRNLKFKYLIREKVVKIIEEKASSIKGSTYEFDKSIPLSYLIGYTIKRIRMLLNGMIYHSICKRKVIPFFKGSNVKIKNPKQCEIGRYVTLHKNVYIDSLSYSGVKIRSGASIGENTIIRVSGNNKSLGFGFYLGEGSSLADNCFVGATGGVYIGSNVIGGQSIRFHASNHKYEDKNVLIKNQGIDARGIRINDNCWIGAGVVFCDGVTIGEGCVIAANSVVTKSFPRNSVIAGVPAKKIKTR